MKMSDEFELVFIDLFILEVLLFNYIWKCGGWVLFFGIFSEY